jgi:hypothetical protein
VADNQRSTVSQGLCFLGSKHACLCGHNYCVVVVGPEGPVSSSYPDKSGIDHEIGGDHSKENKM